MITLQETEVRKIIRTDIEDISHFISTAQALVNSGLSGVSDDTKKLIGYYLVGHFLTLLQPEITSEKIGDSEIRYKTVELGEGLDGTTFGQTALILDTSGYLKSLSSYKPEIVFI